MNARIAALGLLLLLLLPLAAGSAVAAEEGSSVKDAAKAAVSSAIETGKNLLGGVSEGITSGRQSAQGADGAKVVSDNAGFAEIGQVEVLKTEPRDQQLAVTLGFKNDSDATVRLINLTQTGALLVIDNDGYSNALVALANPDDVTVPAKGIRQTFVFEGGAEGIKAVRLWGKDLPVK
ncbi:hypothetical protein C0045_01130 [Pseudomonas aeruginosa]|uniref:hypothetical protein n=1 Tax=Pseudomonas aeruginosa TaxID=287 RepID=UPI000D72D695|nr:hypothetical protein [Pseudomonas aeruginosa]PXB80179.1 hypothetical protein C0045_01130 [Pseudomonas aeruginosa]